MTVLILAVSILSYTLYISYRRPVLEIYIIPLKTGQSIFIRTPDDKRILIDGGPNAEIIKHITDILPFYTRHIDTIIVSQMTANNVTGLIDVLKRYKVGRVIISAIDLIDLGLASSTDQIAEVFLNLIDENGLPLTYSKARDNIILSGNTLQGDIVNAEILFPIADFKYSKASPPEIILKVNYGSSSAIYIGNATTKIQKSIAVATPVQDSLKSDVLITSKSIIESNIADELVEIVNPKFVIYSKRVSDNETANTKTASNNDSKSVSKIAPFDIRPLVKRFNIRESGIIKIESDGRSLQVFKY
jgi:beta-lactamase superfamily II metal-dependent hydrolase